MRVDQLPGFRYANMPRRAVIALHYYSPRLREIARWTLSSREDSNFTYALTENNLLEMAFAIAVVTGSDPTYVRQLIDEARGDAALRNQVEDYAKQYSRADQRCEFGRRLGWYAFVRILKPRLVIETGVDKGMGSILLCAAILRNGCGRYVGTDINPNAGGLLRAPYSAVGEVLYGDSIESLKKIADPIDLFINDSNHSIDYEYREYGVIGKKLSPNGVILGDNSHWSPSLLRYSEEHRRRYLFFREQPEKHWYPGAGIGISFASAP